MSDAAGLIMLVGRIVFASFFAMGAYRHLTGGAFMIEYARAEGFPIPTLASWPAGVWLMTGAVSVGVGIWPDIGCLMLIAFLVPAMMWFHAYWKAPEDQAVILTQLFFHNVTFIGACIALFAVFGGIGEGLRFALTTSLIDLT